MNGLDLMKILYHIINLIILFLILRFLLYKPVTRFLKLRQEKIEGQLNEVEENVQKAKDDRDKASHLLADVDAEGRALSERIRAAAKVEAEEILERARNSAEELLVRTRAEQALELERAREAIGRESVNLAVDIAEKILARELTPGMHEKLVEQYLGKMEAAK